MLTIADSAAAKIQALLKGQEKDPAAWALKISVSPGGCSGLEYKMDFEEAPTEPVEGVNVFEQDGARVLIDSKSLLFVGGAQLVYNEGLTNAGFEIKNPNATGTCGCGQSFSV